MSRDTALLLLHGFTGGAAAWRPVIDHLRARGITCPVRTPALLGHGRPPAAPKNQSFSAETARIAEHVRQLATDTGLPVHLVGYSLGARVALGVLVEHGLTSAQGQGSCAQDLAHVTLIGVHPGLPEGPERPENTAERDERRTADRRWIDLLRTDGLDAFLETWEALPLFASQHQLPADVQAAQRDWRRRHRAEGLAHSLEILGLAAMPDYGRRLAEALASADRSPSLQLVAGADDAKFSALAQELAERLTPSATSKAPSSKATQPQVHLLPGVGHNPVLETPAALADLLTTPPEEIHP